MANLGGMMRAVNQFMQNYDIDKVIQDEQLDDLKALLASKLGIKADAKESLQLGLGMLHYVKAYSKLKKKGKTLTERMQKGAPTKEAKEVSEVAATEEGEGSLDEMIEELQEQVLPTDEKLNRYENARIILDMSEDPDQSPEDMIEFLIQPTGPYGKRPVEADKVLSTAIDEMSRQVKILKAKRGKDHSDVLAAQSKLEKVKQAKINLMSFVDTSISSQYTGTPVGKTVLYKSKIRQDTIKQNPNFKDEEKLKAALQTMGTLFDRTSHNQWCSQYNYKQIITLFTEYSRETSEILNSEGAGIEPGLLASRLNITKNNTAYKFSFRVFVNEMIWAMKEWDAQVAASEEDME